MARISKEVPLKAYDHVAKLLQKAGGKDGVVSRADAKELVDSLKKQGAGTEAEVARNIFKMVDMRETKAGARVTGYDLNTARAFVQEKMIERLDTNNNGLSQAEINRLSKTGKGLVELGRVLSMETGKGRVAHSVPKKGMEHIAKLINNAGGKDLVVSREDRDALVSKLYKAGRGTEALAVSYFFNFIDKRDYKPGARITVADIEKAVEYSGTSLLKNKDKNRNGFSADEIADFSTTARAFLLVGEMLDAGIIKQQ